MARLAVAWTPDALQRLSEIREFISGDSLRAADRTFRRIRSEVALLSSHPEMGRPGRVPLTRELVISRTPYIVAYSIYEGQIEILSVMHGAQDWPKSF